MAKTERPRNLAIATAHLKSISPYSQSKAFDSVKRPDEDHDQFDERCWREHMHVDAAGNVVIPPMQFKQAVDAAASRLNIKIEKKGVKQFIEPGVMVVEPMVLDVRAADVKSERLFLTADGKPSKLSKSGRVYRRFPVIPSWEGLVAFHIVDARIGEGHFRPVLVEAGNLVGIGRWRPEKRGFYGRFSVVSLDWKEIF